MKKTLGKIICTKENIEDFKNNVFAYKTTSFLGLIFSAMVCVSVFGLYEYLITFDAFSKTLPEYQEIIIVAVISVCSKISLHFGASKE